MTATAVRRRRLAREYSVYGAAVRSDWPLPARRRSGPALAEIDLRRGSSSEFASAIDEVRSRCDAALWRFGVRLGDGRTYIRWPDRVEALISADGSAIVAREIDRESRDAFYTYLLGHALSFALISHGIDPIHATVIAVGGRAVALFGDCGYGKSSLAAAFLRTGHRLLTDDLLVLSPGRNGFTAQPGPPRIKLFPDAAQDVLGGGVTSAARLATTAKLFIRLNASQTVASAVPLHAAYTLTPPWRSRVQNRVALCRLSQRQACVELLANTFNASVVDPSRLARQFAFAARVGATVVVKRLTYPRTFDWLPRVRDAILADIERT
jgi:hypothetical protein